MKVHLVTIRDDNDGLTHAFSTEAAARAFVVEYLTHDVPKWSGYDQNVHAKRMMDLLEAGDVANACAVYNEEVFPDNPEYRVLYAVVPVDAKVRP